MSPSCGPHNTCNLFDAEPAENRLVSFFDDMVSYITCIMSWMFFYLP